MGLAITCFCRLAHCTLDPLLNHTLIVVCRLLQSLKLDHKRQHTLNIQSRTKHILSTHQKNPVARIKISATRKRWVPPEQFLKSFVKMKSENGGENWGIARKMTGSFVTTSARFSIFKISRPSTSRQNRLVANFPQLEKQRQRLFCNQNIFFWGKTNICRIRSIKKVLKKMIPALPEAFVIPSE